MTKEEVFKKLFQFTTPTFYAWKKEKRPVMDLIKRYFSNGDIQEFLDTGIIQRFEITKISQQDKNEEDLLKAFRSLDDKHKKYYLLGIQRAALKKEILEDQRKDL